MKKYAICLALLCSILAAFALVSCTSAVTEDKEVLADEELVEGEEVTEEEDFILFIV